MPLQGFFLIGGDRRQTCLAALLAQHYPVYYLQVPAQADRLPPAPCHIILPCPAFSKDGSIRGSSLTCAALQPYLLPETIVFAGQPGTAALAPAQVVDLLADEAAVWENARLTAEAALLLVRQHTGQSLFGKSCAVVGFGRIGKLLAHALKQAGAEVTVLARSPSDRAYARALALRAQAPQTPLREAELIFNTVPARICPAPPKGALWVELASAPGGLPEGTACLPASALPGRLFPASAAEVLYRAVFRAMER